MGLVWRHFNANFTLANIPDGRHQTTDDEEKTLLLAAAEDAVRDHDADQGLRERRVARDAGRRPLAERKGEHYM